MTGVLDAPLTEVESMDAARPRRASAWARRRVALRLARRQVWRAKGASALVVALVALPVAGLTAAAIVWQSHVPTPQQRATLELGSNAAWFEALDNADPTRVQAVDQPWDNDVERSADGNPTHIGGPVPGDPSDLLPPGTDLFAVVEGQSGVETESGVGWLTAVAGDVWDPSFAGKYLVLEGSAPTGADQMMASPGALERIGARIGDRVRFVDDDRTLTVSGTLRDVRNEPAIAVLYVPEAAAALVGDGYTRWYAPDWQPDLGGLAELNHAGFVSFARDLAVDPPAGARLSTYGDGQLDIAGVITLGALIAAFSGYIVVLLSGAAFSVAARRQQRALAMTASVGATRGDVFRVVVLQGTVLGFGGAVAGTLLGGAAAALFLALTDRGALGSFWGNFGYRVPWPLVGAIVAFAFIVGTLAAIMPARRATKGDVLGALRGARRPADLRPRRPLFGLLAMGTGLAATVLGALVMAAQIAASPTGDYDAVFYGAVWAVVLGPFVFQIGLLIPSHWVLVQLSRPLARCGLAPRLASRDAAATPSRVVPAFAVIGACVFAASVAVAATALTAGANARGHYYSAPEGALVVTMWQEGDDASDALLAAAEDLVADTDPAATVRVSSPAWPAVDADGAPLTPDVHAFGVARQRYSQCVGSTCLQPYDEASGVLYVVDPDEVATLLGVDPGGAALSAMADGAALVAEPDFVTGDGDVIVTEWEPQSYNDLMATNDVTDARPVARHRLDAVAVDVGHLQSFAVMVAPATAAALGMPVAPTQLVATYDIPLTQSAIDRIMAESQDLRVGPSAGLGAFVEAGPGEVAPWLWLIVGVAIVLVAGASAVALGLARVERRPDDATLAAIGGSQLLRRNVNAWQALVIAGVGTIVGTAAGYVSMWGFATANAAYYEVADMPWLWLGVLSLGLPAAIVLAAWLVPPRHPDLTRRTVIA